MKSRLQVLGLLLIVSSVALTACGDATPEASATDTPVAESEHTDEEEHMDEHVEDEHMDEHAGEEEHMDEHGDIPDDAAAVPNPIEATDESVGLGAGLYATTCAVCHGDTGEGDGLGGASLDPKPANLHEDHVQSLTDGALFYVISNGVADTGMAPWEDVLTEDQRWHIVNFMRTFADG
jgi:cytochrome c553